MEIKGKIKKQTDGGKRAERDRWGIHGNRQRES